MTYGDPYSTDREREDFIEDDEIVITTDSVREALTNAGLVFFHEDMAGGCWALVVENADMTKPDVIIGPFHADGTPHDAARLPGVSNDWAACVYVGRDPGEDLDTIITVFTPEQAVEAVRRLL